jgi:hypothetical protein
LDLLVEVDFPGKNVRQLGEQGRVQSDPRAVLEKRRLDDSAGGLQLDVVRFLALAEHDSFGAFFPCEDRVVVLLDLDRLELLFPFLSRTRRGLGEIELNFLAGAEGAQREMLLDRLQPEFSVLERKTVAHQYRAQGVARFDLVADSFERP